MRHRAAATHVGGPGTGPATKSGDTPERHAVRRRISWQPLTLAPATAGGRCPVSLTVTWSPSFERTYQVGHLDTTPVDRVVTVREAHAVLVSRKPFPAERRAQRLG